MKNILFCILVNGILLSGFQAAATITPTTETYHQSTTRICTTYEDELDQSMDEFAGSLPVGNYAMTPGHPINIQVAQSFIPQKEVLTRIQLFMARNSTATHPCIVSLRQTLHGSSLATIELDVSSFPLYDPQTQPLEWIEFDIPDKWVNPGETYYIVVYTANVTGNHYWIGGNSSNLYPHGNAYLSMNNGTTWNEITDTDGCFKTYGLEETFLKVDFNSSAPFNLFQKWTITNIGNATAWDIVGTVSITGGILGRIKKTITGTLDRLDPDQQATLTLSNGLVFGLGPISIKITIYAANVREISITKEARILLWFIIL